MTDEHRAEQAIRWQQWIAEGLGCGYSAYRAARSNESLPCPWWDLDQWPDHGSKGRRQKAVPKSVASSRATCTVLRNFDSLSCTTP